MPIKRNKINSSTLCFIDFARPFYSVYGLGGYECFAKFVRSPITKHIYCKRSYMQHTPRKIPVYARMSARARGALTFPLCTVVAANSREPNKINNKGDSRRGEQFEQKPLGRHNLIK